MISEKSLQDLRWESFLRFQKRCLLLAVCSLLAIALSSNPKVIDVAIKVFVVVSMGGIVLLLSKGYELLFDK